MMDEEALALSEWRQLKRDLRTAIVSAERAIKLHPSPLPPHWIGVVPRLRELLADVDQ